MPEKHTDVLAPRGRERSRREALATQIAGFQALFADAVETARLSGTALPEAAQQTVRDLLGEGEGKAGEFARLIDMAREGQSSPRELASRAAALARLRAYVLPPECLAIEARAACAEMAEWQVPAPVLAEVQQSLGEVQKCSAPEETGRARAALKQILETYDYWDWYTDWFFTRMRDLLIGLGVIFAVSFIAALYSLHRGHGFAGFLLAGVAGTHVSIMLKMPALSVFGEVGSFAVKMAGRAAAGIAAAAIGAGLFSFGVVSVPLSLQGKTVAFAEVMGQCGEHCTSFATLILLALGMLLGFSERALATFEDATFAAGARKPPA
jgi:hypothetical protein